MAPCSTLISVDLQAPGLCPTAGQDVHTNSRHIPQRAEARRNAGRKIAGPGSFSSQRNGTPSCKELVPKIMHYDFQIYYYFLYSPCPVQGSSPIRDIELSPASSPAETKVMKRLEF